LVDFGLSGDGQEWRIDAENRTGYRALHIWIFVGDRHTELLGRGRERSVRPGRRRLVLRSSGPTELDGQDHGQHQP
jgi:hypothetical protein